MTDEQLETLAQSIKSARHSVNVLVDLEDYLDQIALMATIVSHYSHQHPDKDGVQVRMIARLAEQGSKILKKVEQKLDSVLGDGDKVIWDIELERIREQEEKAKQDSKVINLLQVTEDRVLN